jgi:Tat protein translocase TatC
MVKFTGAIAGARIVGERWVHGQRRRNPEGRMPLMDHLRELRNRVVKMALALAAGMIAGFVFFGQAWRVIERPLCAAMIGGHSGCRTPGIGELVLTGPLDAFYLRVKVALIVGAILSSPIWLYQIWAFAAPGLNTREKRWSYLFPGAAIPLFALGITLCYLSLGRSLRYLLGLTPGGVQNLIQVDQYLSFAMAMMVAFGLAFEAARGADEGFLGGEGADGCALSRTAAVAEPCARGSPGTQSAWSHGCGDRDAPLSVVWTWLAVSFEVPSGLVWRTSRACSAARVMLSLMKPRKRAMFSRRAAAGVWGPRMTAPWRAVSTSWSLDRALAIVAW